MGLDMYLTAKRHVSGYSFYEPKEQAIYAELVETLGVGDNVDPETPSGQVELCVAYWRKANAIHAWFVREVQDGVDECQTSFVPREKLVELRDLCLKVLGASQLEPGSVVTGIVFKKGQAIEETTEGKVVANPAVAQEHLPTQSGFFFGNTDYDEWYVHDLEDTVKQLDRALELHDEWQFYYNASW